MSDESGPSIGASTPQPGSEPGADRPGWQLSGTELTAALRAALGDHFAIDRPLGAGAMGSVFLGRDRTLDRPVAIKVISPELGTGSAVRQRFLQEARTVARLRHHNIVTVYAAGDADGLLYHVMEYVPGESLRERLDREGTLPPLEVAALLHELAGALGYANSQGVIHRDIKPENVLLDAETGRALLADFGVAQALAGGEGETGAGMVMGSPRYMSPEQAAGTRVLDGRSDLYSLCLVGYEMLAGEPPFVGPGVPAVIAQQISTAPMPLAELAPEAPPVLVSAIERGLEKDPALRWPDASALAAALAPLVTVPASTGEAEVPEPVQRRFSRHWWRVAAGGAATMALLIGVGSWLSGALRGDGPPAGTDPRRSVLVVPFDLLNAGPDLRWIRDGSVSMLTLDMAQWSDVQVVDYEHTLDLLRDAGLDTASRIGLADARRLARAAGAWSVVTGQVRRGADSLFVVARLYDVASGRALEQSQHAAPAGADPRAIFDAIARALLRIAGAPAISPELARTTTTSLSAYRDYLDGVRALNGWELERADSLLGAAVAADSTFALAHYKRAVARGWSHLPDSTDVAMAAAAARHAGRLPERDRMLVESYLALVRGLAAINVGDAEEAPSYLARAQEGYAALVARDSTDAEAWYGLGDAYFHAAQPTGGLYTGTGGTTGGALGSVSASWTRALRAFDRTLALDSTFHLAYSHKLVIYQAAGTDGAPLIVIGDSVRTFASDSAARRYGTTRIAESRRRARTLAVAQGRQWVATDPRAPAAYSGLADAYAAAGDFAQAALTLQEALARPGVGTADMAFRVAALQMAAGDDDAFGAVERALRTQSPASLASGDQVRRAPALMAAATVAAYSGARGSMERLLELRTHTDPEILGLGIPSAKLLPVWRATLALGMGVSDRSVRRDVEQGIATLDRIRGAAGDLARRQAATLPFAAYLRQRDTTFLDVLHRWTGRDTPPELQVLAALDAGDTARAERLAVDLPEMDVELSALGGAPPALRQFARAEVFLAMDNPRRALQAYEVLDRGQLATSLGSADPRWPLYARSFLVRGQLHERLGERTEAAAAYERFLTLWRDADPAVAAPDLRAAREGLARVRGGGRGVPRG